MKGIFSKMFHKQTNFDFVIGTPPSDPQYWPKEWREIYHKEYPRFPKVPLPRDFLELGQLKQSLLNRHSTREFDIGYSLSIPEISTLLYYSSGVKPATSDNPNLVRRFYPSGGARYPLEVYVLIQSANGIKTGLYHYNLKQHALEALIENPEEISFLKEGLVYPWSRDAAMMFFITAVWERNMMKYGDRGYRIILMEAGHLAQNLALTAAALGIGCCNSVGFHNQRINEVLNIERSDEDSLYLALIGN